MPIYEYECGCGAKEDRVLLMKDRDIPQPCPKCGKVMGKLISAPAGMRMFRLVYSNALGKYIKNKQDYIEKAKAINANVGDLLDSPY